MMPLAPHISLPAIGHMTATTDSTPPDSLSTSMSSKPKLAFSIDSIVGRNSNNRPTIEYHSDSDRLSPHLSTQNKSRHSPLTINRSVTPPLSNYRMDERIPQVRRQFSPTNRSAANISPMSTPSPISMVNGSANSPYLEPNRVNHQLDQQSHSSAQPTIGATTPLSHPLMMAAAHHMSSIPQPYHQAVALYPWLLRTNPFANRFHGMPFDGGLSSFLLPPFRKPKRIRTAFSPGQLLKLEQAFEKNHYVVGAERKQLASSLGLSETQVKVWFQNRRTKHKRQKQEDDEQGNSCGGASGSGDKQGNKSGPESDLDEEDDEEDEEDIDMEDTEEVDGNTNELLINSDLKHHQLWYQAMQSAHHSTPVSLSASNSLSSSSTTKI